MEARWLAVIDDEPRTVAPGSCADVTAAELAFVLAGLPVDDEFGLPRLSAISDRELRARFLEALKRRGIAHEDSD